MRSSSSSAMSSDGACVEHTGKAPAKLELGFASASRSRCLSTPLRPSVDKPLEASWARNSWTLRAGGLEGRWRFFFSPVAGRLRFREGGDGGTEVESGGFGRGGGASTQSSTVPDSAAASRRKAARQRSNLNNDSGGHSSTRRNTNFPMDWPAAYLCGNQIYGAFVLNRRVDLYAIDATPARWHGNVGSSPHDGASAATRRNG